MKFQDFGPNQHGGFREPPTHGAGFAMGQTIHGYIFGLQDMDTPYPCSSSCRHAIISRQLAIIDSAGFSVVVSTDL